MAKKGRKPKAIEPQMTVEEKEQFGRFGYKDKPKCSCGRISVGWDKYGSFVCSFHNSFPTEVVSFHNYASIFSKSESLEICQNDYLWANLGEKP